MPPQALDLDPDAPIDVIGLTRISRETEESSSLARQALNIRVRVDSERYSLVHMIVDPSVSGAVSPFNRKSSGPWFREPKMHMWKAMIIQDQDRMCRDDLVWWEIVAWFLKHDKILIVLDDPSFDISTTTGRTIAQVKAGVATEYRLQVKKKIKDQRVNHRANHWWPGGTVPFGYRAERFRVSEDESHSRLVIDETTAAYLREAYDRIVNGKESMSAVITDWNQRGVLTSHDYQRHLNALMDREGRAKKLRHSKWGIVNFKYVLQSPASRGYMIHNKKIMRDDTGMPVQWADEILSAEEYDALQIALTQRSNTRFFKKENRTGKTDPLVGVLYCACTMRMHTSSSHPKGKPYFYYQCGCRDVKGGPICPYVTSWPRVLLRTILEESFLSEVGQLEIVERKFSPGVNNKARIKEIEAAIKSLASSIAQTSKPDTIAALTGIMDQHSETLEKLRSQKTVPPRWEETATGETYGEWWEHSNWDARGELLREAGFYLYVAGKPSAPETLLYVPEDLPLRTQEAKNRQPDYAVQLEWSKNVADHHRKLSEDRRALFGA